MYNALMATLSSSLRCSMQPKTKNSSARSGARLMRNLLNNIPSKYTSAVMSYTILRSAVMFYTIIRSGPAIEAALITWNLVATTRALTFQTTKGRGLLKASGVAPRVP